MKFVKDYLLGVIGLVVTGVGAYLCFYSNELKSDYSRQVISLIEKGEKDYSGEIALYFGIALFVIGIVLMLINFGRYWNANIATVPNTVD